MPPFPTMTVTATTYQELLVQFGEYAANTRAWAVKMQVCLVGALRRGSVSAP